MRPQDFYVASRASKGVRVELLDPAGRKEWLMVRSTACREFAECVREVALAAIQSALGPDLTPAEAKYAARRNRAAMAASLIADSSMSIDHVELMRINPRLRRQVERIAEDDSLHFGVSND